MKRYAHELTFISKIKPDGSGTIPISDDYLQATKENEMMRNALYKLHSLSITEGTYIAGQGFGSYIVKLTTRTGGEK